jgi:hypothetical protein
MVEIGTRDLFSNEIRYVTTKNDNEGGCLYESPSTYNEESVTVVSTALTMLEHLTGRNPSKKTAKVASVGAGSGSGAGAGAGAPSL